MTSGRVRATEDILFRTAATPEEPWVGQQLMLSVDVLAKDGWAQLKKIGEIEVDGAYVLRLETQGTRLNEVIDGDSYTGQRYEFMLFPQRDGRFTILPVPVDVEVKSWGVARGDQIHRLSLPVIEFVAHTPPGAEGIRGLISTRDLTAKQSWDPVTDSAEVGAAITRTINFSAEDISGMAFSPLRYGKVGGVGIYPGEPTVEDKFNRGELTGTRVETVTYVFERPGFIEIPGVVMSWWDVRSNELKRVELPGLSMHVDANPYAESASVTAAPSQSNSRVLWYALSTLTFTLVVAIRYGRRISDQLTAWRKARSEAEAVYFRQLMRAARSGDGRAVLRNTMRWLDRINSDSNPARLDQFLQQYGDPETQLVAQELLDSTGERADQTNFTALARGFSAARARWLKAGRIRRKVDILLPALNGSN